METELKPLRRSYRPGIGIRLLCCLTVYAVPQIPWAIYAPTLFFRFPIYLLMPFVPDSVWYGSSWYHFIQWGIIGISYGYYVGHLAGCFYFRGRRAFLVLFGILIVAVIMNVAGLYREIEDNFNPIETS